MKIAIVDYGVGNLFSVKKAFKYFLKNDDLIATEEPTDILSADALVLPGVGSFESGVEGLKIRGLVEPIKKSAEQGKSILGICLGAQLLMSHGYEFGVFQGLDIIKGKVVKFPQSAKKTKIPHIGWNKIYLPKAGNWQGTILENTSENSDFYFVHSYILCPENPENILSLTTYGDYEFCSAIVKDKIYGTQFHPEKSAQSGLKIIETFINQV